MRRLWIALALGLGALLWASLPLRAETDEPMKPHGGISSVKSWNVQIHLIYKSHEANRVLDAESNWNGTLRFVPGCEDLCQWTGPFKVHANAGQVTTAHSDHTDTWTAHAQGDDEQPMALTFYDDDTYEFGFGYADVPGKQTIQCSAGKCECDPDITASYSHPLNIRLPLPKAGTSLTGARTFDSSWRNHGNSIPASDRFDVTWSFTPVGQGPKLKAVANVAKSVQRGDPVTLDGTASTGQIQEYKWTFSGGRKAPDGSMPKVQAELLGPKVQVVLLDGMQVKLTVSDGRKTDSQAVPVTVMARTSLETKVTQEPGETPWAVPAPMYGRPRWFGGENVCAIDPPANVDEPTHVLHPKSNGFTLARVSDQGPYDGFSYVKEWQIEVKRKAYINKWVLENAPPILPSLAESFYQANVRLKTDVVAYLAAARKHEHQHTVLMEKSIRANDPAKAAEKSYGKSDDYVRQQVVKLIDAAEKAASKASQDPLPKIWTGKVAVPSQDTGEWKIIETDV